MAPNTINGAVIMNKSTLLIMRITHSTYLKYSTYCSKYAYCDTSNIAAGLRRYLLKPLVILFASALVHCDKSPVSLLGSCSVADLTPEKIYSSDEPPYIYVVRYCSLRLTSPQP
ncbi:Piso0_000460 [Millerozyma farinosa CBS 7064]|uniref:Piso0_000460 protein n=1 Tax=Pichia sorbitophila (strain ATCC MYA-4447 / BCRC 22081 / CBS 7064 / NBRC 10061 / NRRL Y-12695) TaxID=559304 RepID=G8YU19_PICSO|nr:Piso0_000460 [Millerozyma farinosa CBS 7064]CCE73420.1 Piso0_000460 [Millerozyma farinosa CBS 7064]